MISDTTKLQKKLLQMDIELRQHQIREAKARTLYFQAATKYQYYKTFHSSLRLGTKRMKSKS